MSRYLPDGISSADLRIAEAPYFGGEFALYLTPTPALLVGKIALSAADTGVLTLNNAYTLDEASDLQVVCTSPLKSAVKPVITLACEDDTSVPATMNGVATFEPPSRAVNQSYRFQRGYAVDLIPATPGKLFTEVTSLGSVVGGDKLVEFAIYKLPALSEFTLIGCTTDKNFTTKARLPKGVNCGMEADKYMKRGMTQEGILSVTGKLNGFGDGLARFDGELCTAMLVGIKDGQVIGDRLVFIDWTAACKPSLPDQDGESTISAEGKYTEAAFFVAP